MAARRAARGDRAPRPRGGGNDADPAACAAFRAPGSRVAVTATRPGESHQLIRSAAHRAVSPTMPAAADTTERGGMPTTRQDLAAFVAGLPKAELHVHHIGSVSPRIVAKLAERHPGSPVPSDPAALADYFVFRDFAHFIEVYLSVVDLVHDAEDVRMLTYEVARDMAARHIRYAELTVTPYSHIRRGIPAPAFVEAIEDARRAAANELGVALRWCFDIPGEAGIAAAEGTLAVALEQRPDGLVAFGLGGPEIGVPRPQFRPYFDKALAAGLHSMPHAGETTGPETVWDALRELHAERIGHGTSVTRDPALVEYLGEHRIPLEVCPTSNLRTRAVATLEEHPLREMVAAGLRVTINSDDPPMFGTDLCGEYLAAADLLGLDETGVADLARAAVDASFLDIEGKARLNAEISGYLTAWSRSRVDAPSAITGDPTAV
jgi:aminodeoxyfutalosine deaminase